MLVAISKHTIVPSDADLQKAINQFKQEFPEDDQLRKIDDEVLLEQVKNFLGDSRCYHVSPSVDALGKTTVLVAMPPCTAAIASVIVDVVFMVLGFVGLHVSANEAAERAVVRLLGGRTLPLFQRLVQDLARAATVTAKAKAIWAIAGAAYNAGMIRGVLGTIKNSMHWWDWAITGVAAVAQIVALVATDGVAFIAEIALNGAAIAYVVSDSVAAGQACA